MKRLTKSHAARHGKLFHEPESPKDIFTAYVDGASRGNPGPASYAVIIRRPDGTTVYDLKKYLGVATNNVAEYFALIAALDYATTNGVLKLRVRSDSELLVQQMRGMYKVRSQALRPLYERAQKLSRQLAFFAIEHVPREQNAEADRLANEALDHQSGRSAQKPGSLALPGQKSSATRQVRARFVGGVFVPDEPPDLPEGAEVDLTVTPSSKK